VAAPREQTTTLACVTPVQLQPSGHSSSEPQLTVQAAF
jgi:hypothetical protein